MHLEVPDEATLVATLRAGLIPPEISERPVRFVEAGSFLIEPTGSLSRAVQTQLRAGGLRLRQGRLSDGQEVDSWAQMVRCEAEEPPDPPFGEVIFLMPPGAGFLQMSGELLRLGCPTQEWSAAQGSDGEERAMIRVTAPPYYLVLRALEQGPMQAFLPRANGVWVELGWRHPLEPARTTAARELVLIPGSGPWRTVPDGPWAPLDAHLEVKLPSEERLEGRPIEGTLEVELRLERTSRGGPARLWVLRGDDTVRLERLLATLPAEIAGALRFARLTDGTRGMFVLRSPDMGGPPPLLELEAEAYAPRDDLPNLHLPLGTTLGPPLTTEQLRSRISPSLDELVWVVGGEPLRVERAPESAFIPLSDLVDYIIERAQEVLTPWIAGALFEFEAYRETRNLIEAPVAAEPPPRARKALPEVETEIERSPAPPPIAAPRAEPVVASRVVSLDAHEAELEVARLEQEMGDSPPETPSEGALRWRTLGEALSTIGRGRDAAHAFARAAWANHEPAAVYETWLSAHEVQDNLRKAAELLKSEAAGQPFDVVEAQRWLDVEEQRLPVHLLWLARTALAGAVGGDLLGLLRTRDAIIARIEEGLSLSRDVPSFVRRLDERHSEPWEGRLHEELERLWSSYQRTDRERNLLEAPSGLTDAYVRLLIRWGHARLGERTEEETTTLDRGDPVHGVLVELFERRIEQAREGQELSAPVPADLRRTIENLPSFDRFKVERMWHGSRVLGGSAVADVFSSYTTHHSRPDRSTSEELAPEERAARLDAILFEAVDEASAHEALALASELPEALAVPVLPQILAWVGALPTGPRRAGQEALLHLADHLGRPELVEQAWRAVAEELATDPVTAANVCGRSARLLARAGLERVLTDYIRQLREGLAGTEVQAVEVRLSLAAAEAALGHPQAADSAIDEGTQLLGQNLLQDARLKLIRALALALARTSAGRAIGGVQAILPSLTHVTDMFSTNSHFCVSVFHFMESMVLALTGRELTIGPRARRWLDEDEASFRARVHEDLSRARQ